jgi:hypothetical protein
MQCVTPKLLPFAVIVLVSCGDTPVETPDGESEVPTPARIVTPHEFGGTEVIMAEISQDVPEFAGFHVDKSGVLVVRVTSRARAPEATSRAVAALTARGRKLGATRVETTDFSFTELARWRNLLRNDLPNGVYSIDLDQQFNRLTIGVKDGETGRTVVDVANKLAIAPGAVMTVIVRAPQTRQSLSSKYRPAPGGVQITFALGGEQAVCSIGITARRWALADYTGFLTASHCSAVAYEPGTSTHYQNFFVPHPWINNAIGSEFSDPVYWSGTPCPATRVCRWTDILFSQASNASNIEFASIARPTGSPTYLTAGPTALGSQRFTVVQEYQAIMGDKLHKVGRTSGWTYGYVTADCVDHFSGEYKGSAQLWILCSDDTDIWSEGGDSGSPIFYWPGDSGDSVYVSGILWGGPNGDWDVTWYSPLSGMSYDSFTTYSYWP